MGNPDVENDDVFADYIDPATGAFVVGDWSDLVTKLSPDAEE